MSFETKSTLVFAVVAGGLFVYVMVANILEAPPKYDMATLERQYIAEKEDKLFTTCEVGLKANLKSPDSYKFIKKMVILDELQVYIDYDAINSYGAALRGNFQCKFKSDETNYLALVEASDDFKPLDSDQLFKAQLAIIKNH